MPMRNAPKALSSLVVAPGIVLAAVRASAGSLVKFDNVSEQETPTTLSGYLAQPDGAAPFPAIVVLHWCGGISSHSIGIADALSRWGYIAVAVNSLGPRGMRDACGQFFIGQATDAYAAARFSPPSRWSTQTRVAVLGQSMGGSSALSAVERGSIERRFPEKFAAAISYYPSCRGHSATLIAPTLILIGEADDLNRADACPGDGEPAASRWRRDTLVIYPSARHAFDVEWFQPAREVRGH
jgi:dienelactone hydrolase